jgi:hypothetical protein
MALLLSAFFMHGFTPGPEMLTKHLDVTYSIIWTLTIAHIMAAVICLCASTVFAKLSLVRVGLLVPGVLAIVFVGALNASQSWGDLISVAVFGALGWVMKQLGWPRPPLILGFVLGSMFERYFFISSELYGTSIFTRPVVVLVFAAAAWVVLAPAFRKGKEVLKRRDTKLVFGAPRLSANGVFTLGVFAVVIAAIVATQDWLLHARLVPLAAAYAAAAFSALGFVTDTFFRLPSGAKAPAHDLTGLMDGPALELTSGLDMSTIVWRGFRFFLWIAMALGAMAVIGLLPGLFLTVALMARLEFKESNLSALLLPTAIVLMFWLLFDRIFGIAWPLSVIGDIFPSLRAASHLI